MKIRNVDRGTLAVLLSTDDANSDYLLLFYAFFLPYVDRIVIDVLLLTNPAKIHIDLGTLAVLLSTDDANSDYLLLFFAFFLPYVDRIVIDTLTQTARQNTFADSFAQYYCLLSTVHICYRLIDWLPTVQYIPRTWPKKQVYSALVCTCLPSKQHQNKLSQISLHDRPKPGQRLSKLSESVRSASPLWTIHRYLCFDSGQPARIRTVLKSDVYHLTVQRLHPRPEPHRRLDPQRPRRPRVRHVYPLRAVVHRYPCFDLGQLRTRKTTSKRKGLKFR